MKIVAFASVPIIKVLIRVDEIILSGQDSSVGEMGKFTVYLPSKIVKAIDKGDALYVLCVPDEAGKITQETLAVSIQKGGQGAVYPLYNKGRFWKQLNVSYVVKGDIL